MRVRTVLGGVAACAVAMFGGGAVSAVQADVTIGSTSVPAGASAGPCNSANVIYVQASAPSGTPAGAPQSGVLQSWSVNSDGATPGSPLTLLVLRPSGASGSYTVIGSDSETLPATLPAGGVTSWPIATPVAVQAGDLLGVYVTTASQVFCLATGAPSGYTLGGGPVASAPATGSTVSLPSTSPDGFKLLVSAELQAHADAALGAVSLTPSTVVAGGSAVLQASAGQAGGTGAAPVRFAVTVPDGLPVLAAVAGSGACAVAGQAVSCDVAAVAPGASVPVAVVVGAPSVGSYAFAPSVTVPSLFVDDDHANDAGATATLTVTAPATTTQVVTLPGTTRTVTAPARCTVPDLRRVPQATARKLLALLHCAAGRTTRAYSSAVAKGLVIRASRRTGSYASGTSVGLQVSQGRRPARRKAGRH